MADAKITALTSTTAGVVVSSDVFVMVDVSDTTMAASGTDKQIRTDDLASTVATVGGLIRASIVDAKGDLIVATADNTVTRFAASTTTNYVLVASPGTSTGLAWAAQSGSGGGGLPATTAVYGGTAVFDVPGVVFNNNGNQQLTASADMLYYEPFEISADCTLTDLQIRVGSAAAAGKVARMGIYSADGDWQPATLIVDAGTVAIDSTGWKTIGSLSTSLTAGRYLKVVTMDGTPDLYYFNALSQMWHDTAITNTCGYLRVANTYGVLAGTPVAPSGYADGNNGIRHFIVMRTT